MSSPTILSGYATGDLSLAFGLYYYLSFRVISAPQIALLSACRDMLCNLAFNWTSLKKFSFGRQPGCNLVDVRNQPLICMFKIWIK